MEHFIAKTFGGLNKMYYFRQLAFGMVLAVAMYALETNIRPPTAGLILWLGVNTLLYPYARFVWESIVGFTLGQNIFVLPAVVLLGGKLVTMLVCWKLAILIAPFGLAWLYWNHSRRVATEQ